MAEFQYVTEMIKDDYLQWEPGTNIIFKQGTAAGKTYFTVNTFLPFAQSKGELSLYLSNRKELKKDIYGDIVSTLDINRVKVVTYQELQSWLRKGVKIAKYDNIICDEAHYFVADSWNGYTFKAYNYLCEQQPQARKMWMSATADVFFDKLIKKFNIPTKNIYEQEKNYKNVDGVYFYNKRSQLPDIINSIQMNYPGDKIVVYVNTISRLDKMHKTFGDKAIYYCSPSQHRPYTTAPYDRTGELNGDILFTTKALDNGISIKDRRFRHLIVELEQDMDTTIQAIGRKRSLDDSDTYNLYFYVPADSKVESRQRTCERELEPAYGFSDMGMQYFDELEKTGVDVEKLIRESKILRQDWRTGGIEINELAFDKHLIDLAQAQAVIEKGYEAVLFSRLGDDVVKKRKTLEVSNPTEDEDEFIEFLESNIGVKYFKAEQGTIIDAFKKRGFKSETMGKKVLNRFLKNGGYPYEIKSDVETSRAEGKHALTYWYISKN